MKHALRSQQHHDFYTKYHHQDSEISALPGECGFKQDEYLKEIIRHGLPKPDGSRIPIGRVIAANSTQEGLSHLNSLCDVIVGSFRFVFNEPDKNIVGEKLFKQLALLIWSDVSKDGKTWFVLDKGLIFRPKTFTVTSYEADKNATVQRLVGYMKSG